MRAVVKIEGVHKAVQGTREWLPFTVRLYFYAGRSEVRLVHTIVFDGDHEKDFIRGLGVAFAVPHARAGTQSARAFCRRGRGRLGRARAARNGGAAPLPGVEGNLFADQLAGKRIPNKEAFPPAGQKLLTDWAIWDSYKLVQPTADGFIIQKRTNPQSCWLDADRGQRASGPGVRGRCLGRPWRGREEYLAVIPGFARSPRRVPPRRRNCTSGCGRPMRRPWICATTIPRRTIWIRAMKMCSPASALRTESRAPAS